MEGDNVPVASNEAQEEQQSFDRVAPEGFRYEEFVAGEVEKADKPVSRGYSYVSSGVKTICGEDSDIRKYATFFRFNEDTGMLFVQIDKQYTMKGSYGNYPHEINKEIFETIDAILNRLAMTTFLMPNGDQTERFGLLDGRKIHPLINSIPGCTWTRKFYDKERTKPIDYDSIDHFAFDKCAYSYSKDSIRICLKPQYRHHPGVVFATRNVLAGFCGVTEKLLA